MDQTQALVPTNQSTIAVYGDLDGLKARYQALVQATAEVLREGIDYGIIPGTKEKTLLKPGAEKLSTLFGLRPAFTLQDAIEDWDRGRFYYRYQCALHDGQGQDFANAEGSCNSLEKKYRWRQRSRICPLCGQETIIKGRAEYGGGWLCYCKKGGCGAKFKDGDQSIEGQEVGLIENPDPYDLVNTLQKMAQKRALVAAVLVATGASEFFTQDMEDIIDGVYEVKGTADDGNKPPARQEAKAQGGNGKPPRPQEPESDPLKAAMAYKLDSGRILGQLPDTELRAMLDKINALDPPSCKMRTIKAHVEVLLEYLARTQANVVAIEEPAETAQDDDGHGVVKWPPQFVQAIINANLAQNTYNALAILNRLDLTPVDTVETVTECVTRYRESRDAGGTVDDATAVANAWLAGESGKEAAEEDEIPL